MATRLAWVGLIGLALVSPASHSSEVVLSYRAALGTSVPVPAGWQVGEYQPITVTVIDPDGSRVDEILAIAGHAGSYQYLCTPRTFIGSEWTVLMPASGQPGAWRLTYLGAQQIGGGS